MPSSILRTIAIFTRDLLSYDEQLIRIGRQEFEREQFETAYIVIDTLTAHGRAAAAIVNRALPFGAFVRWRAAELPVMAQWKMMGPGEYVCGLEPSTHEMAPTRRELRERGLPHELDPGASTELRLEIGSLPDAEAIAGFEASLPPA